MEEIPGFYFDKEKNRYFQAQQGAPASKAYSSHDIKRRKLRDEHALLSHASKVSSRARIQRAKILEAPLSGGFFAREQGLASRLAFPEIFASRLTSSTLLWHDSTLPLNDGRGLVHEEKILDYAVFDVDYQNASNSHTVRIAYPTGSVDQYPLIPPSLETQDDEEDNEHWGISDEGHPTSMCTNTECSRHMVTALGDHISSSVSLLPFDSRNGRIPQLSIGDGICEGNYSNVYSSTAAKNNPSLFFACGATDGILSIDKNLDPVWLTPPVTDSSWSLPENSPRVIFALNFLSETPSVLLAGGRFGLLHINDLRVPGTFEKNLDVIHHPSSITHIKQLDTHRIIVAGLNSSLCQYDLRYRKADSINHEPAKARKRRSLVNQNSTRSIVQFPDYHNTATLCCGFDVDTVSGIVAASQEQDEQHSAVQLFSLNGGHTLSSPALEADFGPAPNYENNHIRCIRLARDTESQMKSLLFATSGTIHRYCWGPDHRVKDDIGDF